MKLKNKIFIIFLFLLAFILFFNINNVFAYTFIGSSNIEYSFPDEIISILKEKEYYNEDYYCIGTKYLTNGNYYVSFIPKTEGYKIYIENPNKFKSSTGLANFYSMQFDSSFNIVAENNCLDHSSYYDSYHSFYNNSDSSILYLANGTYYNYDDTVFFQVPVQGVVIPALETAEQIPQAIATTLKILIPVGLIVLSIGFVVYLIKRVRYSTM